MSENEVDLTTKRRLGKSALEVSPLGFGGGPIGGPAVSDQESLDTVAAAWESGVRFFDTAPWYGIGRSERRLGIALSNNVDREEYRINTKVGRGLLPEPIRDERGDTQRPNGNPRTPRDRQSGFRVAFDYTYAGIMRQHEDSLQRLGIAYVDSLTIHDLDFGYHNSEQIEIYLQQLSREGGSGARALEELRTSGAIKAIGCGSNLDSSNAESWHDGRHENLCERIANLVDLDFFVIAGAYTLLDTSALRRLLPMCKERGIGAIGATPYAGGWLAAIDEPATYMYGPAPAYVVERTRRMREVCKRHGALLPSVALQFPLAHPAFATIIPGAKTSHEAAESRRRFDLPVPRAVWNELKSEGLLDLEAPTPD